MLVVSMETKETSRPTVATAAAAAAIAVRQDTRQPHIHSTRHHGTATRDQGQGQGQGQGPWRRYQLAVNAQQTSVAVKRDEDGGRKQLLDPATRAGCVPATHYPSFRTIPPAAPSADSRRLPRVSLSVGRFIFVPLYTRSFLKKVTVESLIFRIDFNKIEHVRFW